MYQPTQYFYPDLACERAQRPFAREYNMADHIARVHKELDPNLFIRREVGTGCESGAEGKGGLTESWSETFSTT